MKSSQPHVVIVGAGFGGVYSALNLAPYANQGKISITIINPTNYFLFTPLLHEVATGNLSARSVTEPLREIFHRTEVNCVQGNVTKIDSIKKSVTLMAAGTTAPYDISYDYLVVSTGAQTHYYGIPGASENTLALKTLQDAMAIRNRVIDSFEHASLIPDLDTRKKMLSFAIVGGGPTGVETAAELVDFVEEIEKRYFKNSDRCAQGTAQIPSSTQTKQFSNNLTQKSKRFPSNTSVHIE